MTTEKSYTRGEAYEYLFDNQGSVYELYRRVSPDDILAYWVFLDKLHRRKLNGSGNILLGSLTEGPFYQTHTTLNERD